MMSKLYSALRNCILPMALSAACLANSTAEYTGRGIFHFLSESGCPLAGPADGSVQCNRIALDDAYTHADLDLVHKTIVFSNTHKYDGSEYVGDVLLQGSGIAVNGERVPLTMHMKLSRKGEQWQISSHPHTPVEGVFTNVLVDPYQISVIEDGKPRIVMTAEQARTVMSQASTTGRLLRDLVQVQQTATSRPGDADITVSLGLGRLSASMARASFKIEGEDQADLHKMLETGTWAIDLRALSGRIPTSAVQQDLFLYQLDDHPLLQARAAHGVNANDQLVLGARNGKGYLRFNGQEVPFAAAADSASAFLEDSFVGLILAWQQHQNARNGITVSR